MKTVSGVLLWLFLAGGLTSLFAGVWIDTPVLEANLIWTGLLVTVLSIFGAIVWSDTYE